jgi:hypothetical protein
MGHKKQYQVKIKQAEKRKKMRKKLAKEGKNVSDYLYGKYYLKIGS